MTAARLTISGLLIVGWLLVGENVLADTSGTQLADIAGRRLVGSTAPALVLKTIDGETIDLGRLYGKKAVYLKFWATWCVPCRQQMPHFKHTFESAGPDLAVIGIDVGLGDSIEAIRAVQREIGLSMPIVFDEDGHIGAAFGLRVTPQHIVIGRNGRIEFVGHLADRRLDDALRVARSPARGLAMAVPSSEPAAGNAPQFSIGDLLPTQQVRLLDGKAFQLRDQHALRPTVLLFLSPWCESYLATTRPEVSANCRRAREQASVLAADAHIRWLGVASGLWATREDLRQYRTDNKLTLPMALDESGALFREFLVNDVPTVIVADAHGKIVQRIEPGDAAGLNTAIAALP